MSSDHESETPSSYNVPENTANRIKALYEDETFPGAARALSTFYRELKLHNKDEGLSEKQVGEILNDIPAYVLQVPALQNYPRRSVVKLGVGLCMEGDLAYMNKTDITNYSYILCCVDIFSQMSYCRPLVTKEADECSRAFQDILDSNPSTLGQLQSFSSDFGGEFAGSFSALLKSRHIKQFYLRGRNHGPYSELLCKKIKRVLYVLMKAKHNLRWDLLLADSVNALNNAYLPAVGMTALKASSRLNEDAVRAAILENARRRGNALKRKYRNVKEPEFALNSYVYTDFKKILMSKQTDRQRGQIYKIIRIDKHEVPYMYFLADLQGREQGSGYYAYELRQAPSPDSEKGRAMYHDIEKIEKHRTVKGQRQYYVKWAGYPRRHVLIITLSQNDTYVHVILPIIFQI